MKKVNGYEIKKGANLWGADLWSANLRDADLRGANLRCADLQCADLQRANLQRADLRGANLWGANLWSADLRRADLWGANIDFSCWPLWCGSLGVTVDIKIIQQLAYHFCSLKNPSKNYKVAREALLPLANKFHRIPEVPKLF